jgi:excisionase family DNA binding protein
MPHGKKNPSAEAVNHSALLTKKQAADYLQVTPRYIERAVSAGRLLAFKPSGACEKARSMRSCRAAQRRGARREEHSSTHCRQERRGEVLLRSLRRNLQQV